MIRTCRRCSAEFDTEARNVKFCEECRVEVKREYQRRYREARRKRIPLSGDDLKKLLKALRAAHEAGFALNLYGGQSFLTEEQLAVVEKKYPDHTQTLRDQREQKFRDAVDNFIKLYRRFGRRNYD